MIGFAIFFVGIMIADAIFTGFNKLIKELRHLADVKERLI